MTTTVEVVHIRLCHSRVMFVKAYAKANPQSDRPQLNAYRLMRPLLYD